jgi:predicted O-linked N-acetylglucosamine transferase (SPINDLY family)
LLAACDVLLDPSPFGGGNTTLESLAVATPVVTLPSDFLCGRITYSLLKKLSLSECIATDTGDYINKAVGIASDVSIQRTLAERIVAQHSQIFNRPHDATAWLRQLINATQ